MSVSSTMIEPVRLRYSDIAAPSQIPIEPPAWKVLPATSVLPKIRLRNEPAPPKKRVTPNTFVYAASGGRHQK